MFFYSPAMLLQGSWSEIIHIAISAVIGVYLLSCAVQGWLIRAANPVVRVVLLLAGLAMIAGGWTTDAIGITLFALIFVFQKKSGGLLQGNLSR